MTNLLNDLALGVKQADTFTVDDIIPLLEKQFDKPNELFAFVGLLTVLPMNAIEAQHKEGDLNRKGTIDAQTIWENLLNLCTVTKFVTEDKEVDKTFLGKLMKTEGLDNQTLAERLELIDQVVDVIQALLVSTQEALWDDIKDSPMAVMWLGATAVQSRMMKASIQRAIGVMK